MVSRRKSLYQFSVLLLALAFAISGSAAASGKDKSKKKSDQAQQQTSSAKVDLNTASEKELDSLPGIGPATIKKIVANRPYSSVDDLKKAVVADAQIEKIRPMVTASAPESSASKTESAGSKSEQSKSDSQAASALPQTDNATAAPPSGSGMVWVNLDSGVYHREGDRWYGKTKRGKYMSEADAQKAGYRAAKTGKGKE